MLVCLPESLSKIFVEKEEITSSWGWVLSFSVSYTKLLIELLLTITIWD